MDTLTACGLVAAAAYAGRASGGGKLVNDRLQVMAFPVSAAVLGYALGLAGWHLAAFIVLHWAGKRMVGWTALFNQILWAPPRVLKETDDDVEWYQRGRLLHNPLTASLVRGFLWFGPSLVLAIWHPHLVLWPLAGMAAFTGGLYAATLTQHNVGWRWAFVHHGKARWEKAEFIREGLLGLGAVLVGALA